MLNHMKLLYRQRIFNSAEAAINKLKYGGVPRKTSKISILQLASSFIVAAQLSVEDVKMPI